MGKPPVSSKPTPKPLPAKNRFLHVDANSKQLAQKLIDLGFLDDAQVETVYEVKSAEVSSVVERD